MGYTKRSTEGVAVEGVKAGGLTKTRSEGGGSNRRENNKRSIWRSNSGGIVGKGVQRGVWEERSPEEKGKDE